MVEYIVFRVKKDRRYKTGIKPNSFEYISDILHTYEQAEKTAKELKTDGYWIGINTITTY